MKFMVPAGVILASIFGAWALWATSPNVEPVVPDAIPTSVRVLAVESGSVRLVVRSQGSVSPSTESNLIPEVSGKISWISNALVNGGAFHAGDLLLRLEDQDYQSALDRASAALARAEAEAEHAKFEYERFRSLQERQLSSRSQTEAAQRSHRVAVAALRGARSNLDQSRRELERTQIHAPFDGLVQKESVDIGQFVTRGNAIATLYARDQVEVRLPIADRQLAYLDLPIGQLGELPENAQPKVQLSATYAGQDLQWTGVITRTEAQIDTASRMVYLIAQVINSEQSIPLSVGLFVNAQIEGLLAENIVTLPRSALRNHNQVLIVDADDKLRYRTIKPYRMHNDNVLIQEGLVTGERICITPLQTARDGMLVNPVLESIQG